MAKPPPVQRSANPVMSVAWLVTGAILLTAGLWLLGVEGGSPLGGLVALVLGAGWAVLSTLPAVERRLGMADDQRGGAFVALAILVAWFALRPSLGDAALAYLLIGMGAYGVMHSAVRLLRARRG